ncbi:MAG TPA: hypothetical protein VE982_03385 [Gaiellaceae bacterium]|nr:hypothetical protein [Gaiellaceae bacterium]
MKHRFVITAALALAACVLAATATAARGGHGQLYQFRGAVQSATSTSVSVAVEGGNRAALRALLGQSQDQTFTIGTSTEILLWHAGIPHVGTPADLKQGDWVVVNVRAKAGSSIGDIDATPAGIIGDHVTEPGKARYPLFLYVGTVSGPQSGGHIVLNVTGGNRLALRTLLGQPTTQTFTYDSNTIFLLWQGKVPTVIDPSQLKAGDRITVRIRAPRRSTLAQVESTPAKHVGDHEPGNPANEND